MEPEDCLFFAPSYLKTVARPARKARNARQRDGPSSTPGCGGPLSLGKGQREMRVVLRRSRFSGPARCPNFLPGRYPLRNLGAGWQASRRASQTPTKSKR